MELDFTPPGGVKEKMLQTNAQGMEVTNRFFELFKELDTSHFIILIEMLHTNIVKKYGSDLVKLIVKNGEQLVNIESSLSAAKYGELTVTIYIANFDKVPVEDVNVLVNKVMEKFKMFLYKIWIDPKSRDRRVAKLFKEQGFFHHPHVQNSYMIVDSKKLFTNSQFLPLFVSLQNVESKFMIHRLKALFFRGVPSSIASVIVMGPDDDHYTIAWESPHIKHQLFLHQTREVADVYTQSAKGSTASLNKYLLPNLLILSPDKRDDIIKRLSIISSVRDGEEQALHVNL